MCFQQNQRTILHLRRSKKGLLLPLAPLSAFQDKNQSFQPSPLPLLFFLSPLPTSPSGQPSISSSYTFRSAFLPPPPRHARKPSPSSPSSASGVVVRLGLHTTNSHYLHVGSFVFPCHLTIRRGKRRTGKKKSVLRTYTHKSRAAGTRKIRGRRRRVLLLSS